MKLRTTMATAAAATLLSGLAACGGGDDEAAQPPAAPAAEAPADTDDDAPESEEDGAHADAGHSDASEGATITMEDNTFSPETLTVKAGETITITNKGAARHNLTDKKDIDSGDVDGGATGSVTAPAGPGEYPFECTYHPGMDGTLTVS